MKIIFDNIYKKFFKDISGSYSKLRVITGYSSSSFIKKVISENPWLDIEVFIGMTREGLSIKEHGCFSELVSERNNLKVYYQVNGVPTHIKLYELSNETSKVVFIGSANFSENGFIKQKEIIGQVHLDTKYLFQRQMRHSLICNHKLIDDYILFYNPVDEVTHEDDSRYLLRRHDRLENKKSEKDFENKIDYNYYTQFNIFAVYPEKIDINWDKTGINSCFKNKDPVLKQTSSNVEFRLVFPVSKEFIIYTTDGHVFESFLSGDFQREIHFKNQNIYYYFRNKIGLLKERPISYNDLQQFAMEMLYFERLNETEYLMHFDKPNRDGF